MVKPNRRSHHGPYLYPRAYLRYAMRLPKNLWFYVRGTKACRHAEDGAEHRPAQLDFTVGGLKPISEGHSFRYGGAPYKCLYGGAPYKSPKIAENRRKSELQADLRGSLILPPTVKSSCAGPGAPTHRTRAHIFEWTDLPAAGGGRDRITR